MVIDVIRDVLANGGDVMFIDANRSSDSNEDLDKAVLQMQYGMPQVDERVFDLLTQYNMHIGLDEVDESGIRFLVVEIDLT